MDKEIRKLFVEYLEITQESVTAIRTSCNSLISANNKMREVLRKAETLRMQNNQAGEVT